MNPLPPNRKGPDRKREPTERLPTPVLPIDFGDDRALVLRALELNRQLLYEPQPGLDVDEAAVRAKIDELLDRLLTKSERPMEPSRS